MTLDDNEPTDAGTRGGGDVERGGGGSGDVERGAGAGPGGSGNQADADDAPDALHPSDPAHPDREDERLDEGLKETFPASDPVSAKHIT